MGLGPVQPQVGVKIDVRQKGTTELLRVTQKSLLTGHLSHSNREKSCVLYEGHPVEPWVLRTSILIKTV